MKKLQLLITALSLSSFYYAQDWTLKLSSNVELRTWKLTSKAEKEEKALNGASIKLFKGTNIISELNSDANGDFTVLVPANGDFILEVSYSGCNTKKFSISTQGVPEEVGKDSYKPTFSIGGFVMAKPFPGIDYSGLQQTLVKVEYKPKGKNFDHDDNVTNQGLNIVQKIAQAENKLINDFCSTNKSGDVALAKPDCPLAKTLYEKAISIILGEQYPVDQLAKVGLCLKDKEDAAKKAEEAKVAKEKANADKSQADKEAFKKAEAEKNANEKLARENLLKQRAESNKLAKEKAAENKYIKPKEIAPQDPEQIIKKKEAAERAAKEKEGLEKSKAEDLAAEKAEYEKRKAAKAEKDKAKAEREAKEKEGLAKSKAEDLAAEKAEFEKREAKRKEKERLAKETEHDDGSGEMKKGNSDYSIPQVIGADKYKENINKGDDYFKTKRYLEAKTSYEAALKIKPNDVIATNKLNETIKKLNK
jgi:hypothetical protein